MTLDWKSLEKVHDYFKARAFALCEKGLELEPQLFVVQADQSGSLTRLALIPPGLVSKFMESGDSKDLMRAFLEELLTDGTPLRESLEQQMGGPPNVVVQVNEGWMTTATPLPKKGSEGASKRTEVLLITLHTSAFSVTVPHEIKTTPHRHAVAAKFPEQDRALAFRGRFALQDPTAGHPTRH